LVRANYSSFFELVKQFRKSTTGVPEARPISASENRPVAATTSGAIGHWIGCFPAIYQFVEILKAGLQPGRAKLSRKRAAAHRPFRCFPYNSFIELTVAPRTEPRQQTPFALM